MKKPIKIGLIGTGRMGKAHLPAYLQYQDTVRLTAISDIDEAALNNYAGLSGVKMAFTDAEEMINQADIDAVDICTPHDIHLPHVIAAARAGKHILLEKAMGRTMDECLQMLTATKKAGVKFMVAQNLRYLPYTYTVKKLIQNGNLGQIRAVRCDSIMNTKQACPPGHWMLDAKRSGGGVVIILAMHMIDLLRYYIGDIKKVTAVSSSVWDAMKNGSEDYACATLEFTNGAIGTLFSIWTVARSPIAIQYMVFGDQGSVYTSPVTAETRLQQVGPAMVSTIGLNPPEGDFPNPFAKFTQIQPLREKFISDNGYINEILHFAECVREDKKPLSSGEDNIRTMSAVLGIYESARKGCAIDVTQ